MPRLTFFMSSWVHSAEVVRRKKKLPEPQLPTVRKFTWFTQIRTGRNYIFTIAACCVWQTPRLLALFELGVLRKVWFRPQVGNFLLSETRRRWFAVGAAFTKLSSPFTTVSGRTGENSQTFYPPGTSASELRRCGGKKKTRVKTFGKEEERHRDTRSPLLFKRRQRGSLRARSWVVTACPTLREKLNNAFLHSPGGFLLQSQRAAPKRVCGRVRAAAALWLTELKPVFL